MSNDPSNPASGVFTPPVSVFAGPIAELVGHRLLSPPTRPGLLATLARYEILRVLGGGGMGVVLMARDTEGGGAVAIKMIRPELVPNQEVVRRFVKEAGHLQKLRHKNVVPVLEVSDRAEGPHFVMPFFEGGSLAQRLKPGQPLEAGVALGIARQVAEGLEFAHRRGIIHRDLKPANILLGPGQGACLADFGLARTLFNDSIIDVEREQIEGTAPYMSPGVAAGNAEDTRCDIYAFGALLYEMLTGDPPYAGRNTGDIRKQILAGPPTPIRTRKGDSDPGLTAVAEGAMARELRDRYADMSDIVADLERLQQGRAAVGPHGLVRRVRRTPSAVWIPAGLALIGLIVWGVWPVAQPAKVIQPAQPVVTNAPPPVVIQANLPAPAVEFSSPIIAGKIGSAGSEDGPGTAARFRSPGGIAIDTAGNLFVADTANYTIRKITPQCAVSTFAGTAGKSGTNDGVGAAARFMAPLGIAVDSLGNVYVAEFATDTIRKLTPDGTVTTLAGAAFDAGSDNGAGAQAHFRNPWAVAVDRAGNAYVSDKSTFTIRPVTPIGRVSTYAGFPGKAGFANGFGGYARFGDPHGVAVDGAGNVFVADTSNNAIRKITPLSDTGTFAAELSDPESIAVDGRGWIYVTDTAGLHRFSPDGKMTNLPPVALTGAAGGPFADPSAIAADANGILYIADSVNNVICRHPSGQTRK